jgi:DAK2 domain fusion protein YloV
MKATFDGDTFKGMLAASTDWLEKIVPDINALNVYPVPDGDTGTNMLMTMRASLESVTTGSNSSVSSFISAVDKGALMGARGNSGVILSQIFHGVARTLKKAKVVDAHSLAQALQSAADTAYSALSDPEEGTILTVVREAATAASKAAKSYDATATSVLAAATDAARTSVINTPNLLPVLKEAGVVDAGGHGLFTILEGALLYIKEKSNGRAPELLCNQKPMLAPKSEPSQDEDYYGFCTQFMIKGDNLSVKKIRSTLENMGQSLIVVGDASLVRVHIHCQNPEAITHCASSFGTVTDTNICSMDEQHQDFLLMKKTSLTTAVIAVCNGAGLVNAFADLGATAILPGGQTMNPSTMDILNAIERVDSDSIIILPNNKNVVTTARLAQTLTKKQVCVIPTKTIPQGIAAMIEFMAEADYETNVNQMAENYHSARSIEITRSTRDARINGLEICSGQIIALLDGQLMAAGESPVDVILSLLETLDIAESSVATIYYGKDASKSEATAIIEKILTNWPHLSAGCENGGQPEYLYILSIE